MNDLIAEVFHNEEPVGILFRQNDKYFFNYYDAYLTDKTKPAISLTLP